MSKKFRPQITSIGAFGMGVVFLLIFPVTFSLIAWALETEVAATSVTDFKEKMSHGPYFFALLLDLLFSLIAGLMTFGYFVFRVSITGWIGWVEAAILGVGFGALANYLTPGFIASGRPIWICAIAGLVAALVCRAVLTMTPILTRSKNASCS